MTDHANMITLAVEVPEVVEEVQILVVKCGGTEAEVRTHGHQGNGDWKAWTGGHVIGGVDGSKLTYAEAVGKARAWVQQREYRRLLHEKLNAHLDKEGIGDV